MLAIALGISLQIVVTGALYDANGWEAFDEAPLWAFAVSSAALWVGWLGVPLLTCRVRGDGPVVDLHLASRWSDAAYLALGVATQFAASLLVYWPLQSILDPDDVGETAQLISDKADQAGTAGIALMALLVAVGAPIAEEVCWRGFLFGALDRRWGSRWAVGVSTVAFAVIHGQPYDMPGLLLIGLVLGVVRARTGRLAPAILAHAGFNLVVVGQLIATT